MNEITKHGSDSVTTVAIFHWTKNFGLNFREFSQANGTAYSVCTGLENVSYLFQKGGHLRDVYPNFRTFLLVKWRRIWFAFRKSTVYRFSGKLHRKCSNDSFIFLNFRKFWSTGKRLSFVSFRSVRLSLPVTPHIVITDTKYNSNAKCNDFCHKM